MTASRLSDLFGDDFDRPDLNIIGIGVQSLQIDALIRIVTSLKSSRYRYAARVRSNAASTGLRQYL
jgi:hypothetical protein